VDEDFRDLLAAFLTHEVRFLVVGAHALAVHGIPRATADLDVWVEPTGANAARVWEALAAFGAPLGTLRITRDDFTRPEVVVQFGLPPRRIDILTSVSGVSFAEAWDDRLELEPGPPRRAARALVRDPGRALLPDLEARAKRIALTQSASIVCATRMRSDSSASLIVFTAISTSRGSIFPRSTILSSCFTATSTL
jgi:hypothetical protein